MRKRTPFRPRVDAMEARALTASLAAAVAGAPVDVISAPKAPHRVAVDGTFQGKYVRTHRAGDFNRVSGSVSTNYSLNGTGTVTGLGTGTDRLTLQGEIHLFVNPLRASTGTLILSRGRGNDLRLALEIPAGKGESLPAQLKFKIISGIGDFKNLAGNGTVSLILTPGKDADHGSLTLTLTANRVKTA